VRYGASNTALAIKVADCLPVSIIDPSDMSRTFLRVAWLVQNITAVTPMPCASSRGIVRLPRSHDWRLCFEVGEEVAERFETRLRIPHSRTKPHVDIPLSPRFFAAAVSNIVDTGLRGVWLDFPLVPAGQKWTQPCNRASECGYRRSFQAISIVVVAV
jgi:hypothetical protein